MILSAAPDQADALSALSALSRRAKAGWGCSVALMARFNAELALKPNDVERRIAFVAEIGHAVAGYDLHECAAATADSGVPRRRPPLREHRLG